MEISAGDLGYSYELEGEDEIVNVTGGFIDPDYTFKSLFPTDKLAALYDWHVQIHDLIEETQKELKDFTDEDIKTTQKEVTNGRTNKLVKQRTRNNER